MVKIISNPCSILSFSLTFALMTLPVSIFSSYISSKLIFSLFSITQFVISSTFMFNKFGTFIAFPFEIVIVTDVSLTFIFSPISIFCLIIVFLSIVSLNSYSNEYLILFLFNHSVPSNNVLFFKSIISIFSISSFPYETVSINS